MPWDRVDALAGPIASCLESFTHDQVVRAVESDAFADAWSRPTGSPTTSWSGL